jgi:hypothetical protein
MRKTPLRSITVMKQSVTRMCGNVADSEYWGARIKENLSQIFVISRQSLKTPMKYF